MRIIGIDPGTAITGFSILEENNGEMTLLDYGCIRTAAGLQQSIRLNQIADDLTTLVKKWKPQRASIEKLFFSKNVKTAMLVAEARGVVLQILEKYGVEQEEYTPPQIKSAVCGNGRADKKAVQEMTKMLLNLDKIPTPDDAADAIAAAICSANTLKIQ
jgi:crossover junction endodeoxyribonuclease RuvC